MFGIWLTKGEGRISNILGILIVITSLIAIPGVSGDTASSEQTTLEVEAEPYASAALQAISMLGNLFLLT